MYWRLLYWERTAQHARTSSRRLSRHSDQSHCRARRHSSPASQRRWPHHVAVESRAGTTCHAACVRWTQVIRLITEPRPAFSSLEAVELWPSVRYNNDRLRLRRTRSHFITHITSLNTITIIIIILFAQKQYKCNGSIKTMSKTHQARISAYGSLSDKPRS